MLSLGVREVCCYDIFLFNKYLDTIYLNLIMRRLPKSATPTDVKLMSALEALKTNDCVHAEGNSRFS